MARVLLHMRRGLGAAGLACLLLAAASGARAADPPRPKVALVLSGGGAMGIAHVGVIQQLEKLGIRPDIVVGTSMGSIVGGLYASGMSGADLQQAVETMKWDSIFDVSPPRAGLTYREKQLQYDFPVKASIGLVGSRVRTPDALISDANLLLELRRLVRVRAAVATFDELPIPFRAVATDIETGQKVVIDRGELAGAMRASMSVPAVFAPYHLNGHLLVDGGMSDNVPVDVAREMGADIVIVSATQTPLAKGDQVRSVPQVLGQTVTMLILANERAQIATLKPTDVLISIDPGQLTAADFKKGAAFVEVGRKAADGQHDALARVASLRAPVHAISVDKPPPRIDYVAVENDSRLANDMLMRRVKPLEGKPLDGAAINAALQDIYALGAFSRVDYRIEEKNGRTGLVVEAEQNPGDTSRLRPAFTLAAAGKGHSEFDVSLELRLKELDAYGSEARITGTLGTHKEFTAEYFKLLDTHQGWFVAPSVDAVKRPVAIYDSSGFRLGEYDAGYAQVALAAGRQFGRWGEFRVGIQRGSGTASLQEGELLPRDIPLDIGQVFASASADTLDNPFFPTHGLRGQIAWTQGLTSLGDASDFQTIQFRGLTALSTGRHAVLLNLEAGDTFQGRAPISSLFTLGGPFNFPGYAVQELTGETVGVLRAMYRFRLTNHSDQLFGLPIYAGVTAVAGNAWARHGDANWNDLRVGGNVFVAADTIVGPVFLVLGAAEHGRTSFYVFAGKPF